jgi:thiamine biosynthesis lipoprotein
MMYQIHFYAMGTDVLIQLDCPPGKEGVLENIPSWFDGWENSISRFRKNSELSRLNQSEGKFFYLSSETWDVLQLSLKNEKDSNGLITAGVLDTLYALGYDQTFDAINLFSSNVLNNELNTQNISDQILIRPNERGVLLPPGLHLDFGGVGKGWACNQVLTKLSSLGPTLVDTGGDIAISGTPEGNRYWIIGIENPTDPKEEITQVAITNCGIATSGRNKRKWNRNGIEYHHLIDPRTNTSTDTDVLSATVIATDVIQAEFGAKMINILGSKQGLSWLASQQHMEALIFLRNENMVRTPGFEKLERMVEYA